LSRRWRFAVALAAAALVAGGALASAEVDPFYADIERSAQAALGRGDAAEAARLFRIACFGMLAEPEPLGACLARLGVAQGRAGERGELEETYRRLAQVEERFQGWSRAPLAAAERAELLRWAGELLTEEQWRLAPSIGAEVAAAHAARIAIAEPGDPRRRRRGEREPAAAPAAEAPVAQSPSAHSPSETTPPLSDDDELAAIATAQATLGGTPTLAELEAARTRLAPFAAARPADAELALLAARLAYRAADWPACAEHYRRAGAPPLDRPLERFYMAVCLEETGARAEAAELVAPVVGALRRTPFVERYLERILGPPAGRSTSSP
jgi:hypothetical protein